jgi:hypothetical protein
MAKVQSSQPISAEIHDLSLATLIPMGGALDRHAYGALPFALPQNGKNEKGG